MIPRIENGWLIVECDAPDMQPVHIALGKPDDWTPAYRDWDGDTRIAKIRPAEPITGRTPVHLRVGSTVTAAGVIRP